MFKEDLKVTAKNKQNLEKMIEDFTKEMEAKMNGKKVRNKHSHAPAGTKIKTVLFYGKPVKMHIFEDGDNSFIIHQGVRIEVFKTGNKFSTYNFDSKTYLS